MRHGDALGLACGAARVADVRQPVTALQQRQSGRRAGRAVVGCASVANQTDLVQAEAMMAKATTDRIEAMRAACSGSAHIGPFWAWSNMKKAKKTEFGGGRAR